MLNKQTTYYLKVDNVQDNYETTILDEELDLNLINAMIKVREGIYSDVELTRVDPLDIIPNNDYYIIAGSDVNFQKTNVTSQPVFDNENKCLSFKGKVFGDQKIHSRGIVNFHIYLGLNDILVYKLKLIGRHKND